MPLRVDSQGDWKATQEYLERLKAGQIFETLDKFGAMGVAALSAATPVDEGETAQSWYYEVIHRNGYHSIRWFNSNSVGDQQVAILLQYGHGTGTGGYVQGRDYIMPAIRPVFDQIEDAVRKEVTR